jgi:ABC-type spermidine/putrescine transport system permease subunit II
MRAIFDVTFRLLIPAILVAMLLAFIHAFNDATFVVFLAGPGLSTVAKTIFDALAYAIDPEVAALSSLFMLFVMALVIIGQLLRRKSAPRS